MYDLYGVLVHHGYSVNSGHYICYVKAANGLWHVCDDHRVAAVGERTVLDQRAYILFYIRRHPRVAPGAAGEGGAEAAAKQAAVQEAAAAALRAAKAGAAAGSAEAVVAGAGERPAKRAKQEAAAAVAGPTPLALMLANLEEQRQLAGKAAGPASKAQAAAAAAAAAAGAANGTAAVANGTAAVVNGHAASDGTEAPGAAAGTSKRKLEAKRQQREEVGAGSEEVAGPATANGHARGRADIGSSDEEAEQAASRRRR